MPRCGRQAFGAKSRRRRSPQAHGGGHSPQRPAGRAGGFFTGFSGGIWIEGLGWMNMTDFLRKQGVVEAQDVPFDNPLAVSASGSEIVGGIAGAQFSWMIEADQVYVCENGQSVLTGFPGGLRAKVAAGAEFGRCEFLD